jgi:hypothetical protein
MTKTCNKCNVEYPLASFSKRKASKDKRQASCKSCSNEYNRIWMEANKEYRKEYKSI